MVIVKIIILKLIKLSWENILKFIKSGGVKIDENYIL
jgi:hypothetical protein